MKNQKLYPILHQLTFHKKERREIFNRLKEKEKAYVLSHLSKLIRRDIVLDLEDETLVSILEQLSPDEATDIIQLLPPERQKKLLQEFDKELRNGIEILSQFDPQTAAGLMKLDYIHVEVDEKIAAVAQKFKKHEKRTGRLPVIIVTEEAKIKGYVPGHALGFARPSEKIKKFVRKIHVIKHNADHDQVMDIFRKHPHEKLAVLGAKGNVIGIIYSDDILKIMQEQESASLYDFAGVHEEETVADTAARKIKFRYKWLIINMGTAFLASFTVGLFEDTISKYVLLAAYMPIVAGMGGNAGTQTLAVLVRGISLKQIELKTAMPTLKREVAAGLGNGLINGLIVAAVVMFFNRDIKIALILAVAMVLNLCVAAFFGTLVPLIMQRLGKDPATSATIFITTATDVLGFIAFLGLATIMLS